MSAELSIFRFEGADVRTVVIDGEVWFIAKDVASALGYANLTDAVQRHCKGVVNRYPLQTAGGIQELRVIAEPDVLRLIVASSMPQAQAFERLVFEEILPSIRKTGTYSTAPALSEDEIVHQALAITARRVQALESHVAELTPRAEAWDELASAEGDYSVADAAAMLNRAGINIGPQRLFEKLGELGWTFRGEKRRWRPYARAVGAGYMAERAQPPHRDADGELVPSPPQIRLTARGVERLRVRLGVLTAVPA